MRVAILATAMLLSACAAPSTRPAPASQADDGIPLGTLPRQALPQGQCALFLWKAGNEARLVVMARVDPPLARIALDGRQLDLPRANADGLAAGAAFSNATYSDGTTSVTIDVVLEKREELQGGAVVTGGSLSLDRATGDSFVMPVAGLLACR